MIVLMYSDLRYKQYLGKKNSAWKVFGLYKFRMGGIGSPIDIKKGVKPLNMVYIWVS